MTDSAFPTSVRSWLGVPFATAGRFQRPTVVPFNPDLPYEQKGPAPIQPGNTSWLEADNGLSEDCLNLNIWAPTNAGGKPQPVVVYIFGGGFEFGANTQITSNASGLAATGRVVGVSLNYRLGPFGFLSLSQYGNALADASNLGLQDVIAALQWVRQNIAHFGGDPDNVTVTGHSAGAYLATALVAAPAADGLYRRVAAFSGGASRIVPAWWAEELAISFLAELGIADDPEQLLTLDAKRLAETFIRVSPREFGQRQSIDCTTTSIVNDHLQPGAVLAGHPLRILESGRRSDIDIVFSSTTNEVDWYVINDPTFNPGSIDNIVEVFAAKGRIPRSRARRIVVNYAINGRSPAQVRGALYTDYSFTLPAARAALAHAAVGGIARLLTIGPVEGAPAVHGTEMYGIVGQQRPGQSDE